MNLSPFCKPLKSFENRDSVCAFGTQLLLSQLFSNYRDHQVYFPHYHILVKFNYFIKHNNFLKPLWNGSYSLKSSSHTVFPFTLTPTQWERESVPPPPSSPFIAEEMEAQRSEGTCLGSHWDDSLLEAQAAAFAPPRWSPGIPFCSLFGASVHQGPSPKEASAWPKGTFSFFFASQFFLLSCLEKVVLRPVQ